MQRYKLAGCAAFLLLAVSSPGRSDDTIASPPATAVNSRVTAQIARLSSPDPDVRADAVVRLTNLRDAAWPVLRHEVQTASPQLRNEIDRVLLHIPWIKQGDNDLVVQAFTQYAEKDADERCGVIRQFWSARVVLQQGAAPTEALLRIVLNDPCGAVRWEAAKAMVSTLDADPALAGELVGLVDGTRPDPHGYIAPNQNAPLIAIAGWALHHSKPAACTANMEKALALEEEHPSAFRGQMDFVFTWLEERASMLRQHQRLIHLLRMQADRTPWEIPEPEDLDDLGMEFVEMQQVPTSVIDLFAAQADFGPDAGFKDDLLIYREYFTHPELVYTLSRLAERSGHYALAAILADTALLMNGTNGLGHFEVGWYLVSHRWNQLADRELKWSLALGGVAESVIYRELAISADQRTDDLAAGKYLEAALQKLSDSSSLFGTRDGKRMTPDDAWADVYCHYMRAAQQSNDLAGIKTNLEKILGNDEGQKVLANTPSMAADVVPALQRLGRNELADKIFDTAFVALQEKVTADPTDPMPKNNLAWLCVCAGKKLDEAARLAEQAVALSPGEGAYLDTQAEVFMRLGQPARAVENEIKALEDRPDDVYMAKQLARFRAAAAQKQKAKKE